MKWVILSLICIVALLVLYISYKFVWYSIVLSFSFLVIYGCINNTILYQKMQEKIKKNIAKNYHI